MYFRFSKLKSTSLTGAWKPRTLLPIQRLPTNYRQWDARCWLNNIRIVVICIIYCFFIIIDVVVVVVTRHCCYCCTCFWFYYSFCFCRFSGLDDSMIRKSFVSAARLTRGAVSIALFSQTPNATRSPRMRKKPIFDKRLQGSTVCYSIEIDCRVRNSLTYNRSWFGKYTQTHTYTHSPTLKSHWQRLAELSDN